MMSPKQGSRETNEGKSMNTEWTRHDAALVSLVTRAPVGGSHDPLQAAASADCVALGQMQSVSLCTFWDFCFDHPATENIKKLFE